MAAVRGRDERVVRVWLECGYVCHTHAMLQLLKWGHADLLKVMSHHTSTTPPGKQASRR